MRKRKLVKDLAKVEIKLDEIDKLLSKAIAVINDLFWDIKISVDKRKK